MRFFNSNINIKVYFQIIAFHHTLPDLPSYLDFAMINQTKHGGLDGVIGQFFKAKVQIITSDNSTTIQLKLV